MLNPKDFIAETELFRLSVLMLPTAETYIELFSNKQTMANIGAPLKAEAAYQSAMQAIKVSNRTITEQLFLHISALPTDERAGVFSLYISPAQDCVEIGIMLFDKYHNCGLAKAVIKNVCIKLLKRYSGLPVVCKINAENKAAVNRAISLGFYKTELEHTYMLNKHTLCQSSWGNKNE
ncbi:MAG TPA: GNAT family N-acetyltransferase [Rheinheimera sp.]|uniref:GNAT family N-acetyltransferase n=1 Tax=Rheinheimera sp. TaxID=1869214 RepID=UPI002F9503E9